MKVCASCKCEKPKTDFHNKKSTKDKLHNYCKQCTKEKNKKWVLENKEKHAKTCSSWYEHNKKHALQKGTEWHYRTTYGISHNEFLLLAEKQSNKCCICSVDLSFDKKSPTRAVLDHNHVTNKIRGVLCNSCNTGIGLLKDSVEILFKASEYLKRNNNE